ncbi:MAG TPA: hypothetical protein VGX95_03250, partial [Xanthobacteraceae bacterium]|nr:hypothetical protein [Xanthobacteraceae bacterium]
MPASTNGFPPDSAPGGIVDASIAREGETAKAGCAIAPLNHTAAYALSGACVRVQVYFVPSPFASAAILELPMNAQDRMIRAYDRALTSS